VISCGIATRVFIVEDHLPVRESLARALEAGGQVRVVAQAGSVSESVRVLESGVGMDVALIDLRLRDGSGLEVVRAVRRTRPEATPVVLTVVDDGATIHEAVLAGAGGYLLKSAEPDEIVAAVSRAARGGAPLTPEVARTLLDRYRGEAPGAAAGRDRCGLTDRELHVLQRLCEGDTYDDVAAALSIALGTVQTHVKTIYQKMGVSSKTELAAVARRRGLT
jgi:DNA-binding NarL/FixJ family response regulator